MEYEYYREKVADQFGELVLVKMSLDDSMDCIYEVRDGNDILGRFLFHHNAAYCFDGITDGEGCGNGKEENAIVS